MRSVECMQLSTGNISDSCNQSKKPSNEECCIVHKQYKCIVSDWSTWSSCSKQCDNGTTARTRNILYASSKQENGCPALKQQKICGNCFTYSSVASAWSTCFIDGTCLYHPPLQHTDILRSMLINTDVDNIR